MLLCRRLSGIRNCIPPRYVAEVEQITVQAKPIDRETPAPSYLAFSWSVR